jgi:hypothetical protein
LKNIEYSASIFKNISLKYIDSELSKISSSCSGIGAFILVLEMLVLSEFEEQGEKHVETFNY